ncbi:hypothetical protein TorRG33x02_310810 [Trema orientale]|uniref:Uncharacterized protein n=1 Tax=Trema orientale TaxID=63057 RepID=A0A2P5BS42_TREOI|nr:hypothetical protein TorRG33x02_310810 [Trema orientale]
MLTVFDNLSIKLSFYLTLSLFSETGFTQIDLIAYLQVAIFPSLQHMGEKIYIYPQKKLEKVYIKMVKREWWGGGSDKLILRQKESRNGYQWLRPTTDGPPHGR